MCIPLMKLVITWSTDYNVMDFISVIGIVVGVAAVVGGALFGDGKLLNLINMPALLVIFGGVTGIAMIQSQVKIFLQSLDLSVWIFFPPKINSQGLIKKIVEWSNVARKEGLLGLETVAETESDMFARKGLQLLVDGHEPEVIRHNMNLEMKTHHNHNLQAIKLLESMGGYCPSLGLVAAVLGLIPAMHQLTDLGILGPSLANSLVAIFYGFGFGYFLFLPMSRKLTSILNSQLRVRELLIEGLLSIAVGENPRNIETKLRGFVY